MFTEAGGEGGGKRRLVTQRSKVSIVDAMKQTTPTGSVKKGLSKGPSIAGIMKSASKASLEMPDGEPRTPSPIPEDPREHDSGKPSTSRQMSTVKDETPEEKKKREEEAVKKDEEKKKEEEGKDDKKKEDEKDEKKKEEGKDEKKKEDEKKKDEEKKKEPPKPEVNRPRADDMNTTKLRGKSKATGQIMGGWI